MVEQPDKPRALSIQLDPAARVIVERLREDTGVPLTVAITRLLEWFTTFDRKARLAILNGDEDTKRELARVVLHEMAGEAAAADLAKGAGPPVNFEDAAKVARLMIDQMEKINSAVRRELPDPPGKKKGK